MSLKLWLKVVHIEQKAKYELTSSSQFRSYKCDVFTKKLASNVQSTCIDNSKRPKSKLWHYCIKATKCKTFRKASNLKQATFCSDISKFWCCYLPIYFYEGKLLILMLLSLLQMPRCCGFPKTGLGPWWGQPPSWNAARTASRCQASTGRDTTRPLKSTVRNLTSPKGSILLIWTGAYILCMHYTYEILWIKNCYMNNLKICHKNI